jgi:hypothetical protein
VENANRPAIRTNVGTMQPLAGTCDWCHRPVHLTQSNPHDFPARFRYVHSDGNMVCAHDYQYQVYATVDGITHIQAASTDAS